MLLIVLGIMAIILGSKAFTSTGIPLTKKKNLTGAPAMIAGIACIGFGLLCIGFGSLSFMPR